MRYLLSICVLWTLGVTFSISAGAENFTVERVRYCTGGLLFDNKCTNAETSANFPEWNTYNVDNARQKTTYISIISEPDIAKVKHVVFISAGQQTSVSINPDGYQNVLTGQPANYKRNCLGKTRTCTRNFSPDGLAMRIKNSGKYDMADTLFILILDSQYNYYEEDKARMVNAYWAFLTSKFWATNVEDIVLAGQSRGGCLSLLLAQRFRKTPAYKGIPLVLQMNDAVCRNDGSEIPGKIPGSKTFAVNPVNPNTRKSVLVNMDRILPNAARTNLFVNNIHGGGSVGGLGYRSLTYKTSNTDIGWWRQNWVKFSHTDMGGNFDHSFYTVLPAFQHIMTSLDKIRYGKMRPSAHAPVDVNGDGLSDVIMFEQGTRRASGRNYMSDLRIKTKLSNGNGGFTTHSQDILTPNSGLEFHPTTPFLAGYFSNDRKTDIANLMYNPGHGLTIRTYTSKGDGTYSVKSYASGDGEAYIKYPALVGDVDGDGLSDILLFYRHAQKGLMVRTKFSKGDGQFRHVEHQLGDGSAVDALPFFAADVNGDNKTDIIMQYQDGNGHKIRTKISNGDGTFTDHEFSTGEWLDWGRDQFFVGDVNRDRKTDLIRVFYDKTKGLSIHSYLSRGNGSYDVKRQVLGGSEPGHTFPAIIADVNGDGRDDIILRYRTANKELIVSVKISNGNGTYRSKDSSFGTAEKMDGEPPLIGTFNKGRQRDLVFINTEREANNVPRSFDTLWTALGQTTGAIQLSGVTNTSTKVDGFGMAAYPAISGPVSWRGQGGTFPPCRPPVCAVENIVPQTASPKAGVKPVFVPRPKPGIERPIRKEKAAIKKRIK